MRRAALLLLAFIALAPAPAVAELDAAALAPIADLVDHEIAAGHLPGAVVLIGHQGKIVYRRAFGTLTKEPEQALGADTIFDLASLTKVVATTTAVLQLAERGLVNLDAPLAQYWPAFQANGKGAITLRQLLAHSSGLRADFDPRQSWSGYAAAIQRLANERPLSPPGSRVLYSDLNFIALGELVRRVSGLPLDAYCQRHIFAPLGMADSGFRPAAALRPRIAPTGFHNGELRRGEVHDPTAQRMGGVAGHAGLFASADDLAIFAQALLADGSGHGQRLLRTETVAALALPQVPATATTPLRGLGWRLEPPFAANREQLPPVGAISHYGYTGTALWLDPLSDTFLIVLSHRVHPDGQGDAGPLRRQLVAALSAALPAIPFAEVAARQPALAAYADLPPGRSQPVATGLDVLASEQFAPLRGKRVGLITNHSGLDAAGRRNVDLLRVAPGVRLVALFSPEHGLAGNAERRIAGGRDAASGLPVHSLYGDHLRPTPAMLAGIDALVFDIQDAGARFYTYISTMGYAMQAAAAQGIPFYVLDRPNPLGGEAVQGPLLEPELRSFTGYFPLPVRHGMTVGELARLFNGEDKIGAQLEVIAMRGYRRSDWFDQTGLAWRPPSPNLRNLTEAILYPGVGMVEGANISVGRGTATPFELLGAPWIDGPALAAYLNGRHIAGVHFTAAEFTPEADRYRQQPCHGVRLQLLERQTLDSPALGIELAAALQTLYPEIFRLNQTLGSIGSPAVLTAIRAGIDARTIVANEREALTAFRQLRQQYLLY